MKKITTLFIACVMALGAGAQEFWLGADISGTSELEHRGVKLYNRDGEERDNITLMRELGLNAARFRVWVNPRGGECDMHDVLAMAQRAQAQGMEIIIDFHYSDWWADPGKQNIPARWRHYNYDSMKRALAMHTTETLELLKKNGIKVKWIQIGNETTNGFLWPMGHTPENMKQYAGLTEAGYRAAKKVYPNAACIVHLDAACDIDRYHTIFNGLKQYKAHFDMIGVSVYPYWDMDAGLTKSEDETLERVIANINTLSQEYNCPVMIVETGYEARRPDAGKAFMTRLIDAARNRTGGHCPGVFYWAPEAEGHYPLGAFHNHRPTAIMDAFTEAATK
jgi:arabinogalactan endo-1,4-beta-galactosidase